MNFKNVTTKELFAEIDCRQLSGSHIIQVYSTREIVKQLSYRHGITVKNIVNDASAYIEYSSGNIDDMIEGPATIIIIKHKYPNDLESNL
jgi:hypothetical protein